MVAAASDQTSTNVQTVASATEELNASVREISRQIIGTSTMSKEAAAELAKLGVRTGVVAVDVAAAASCQAMVPEAAKQMGRHAARNIVAALAGKPMRPFRYRDYGQLATIGRSKAVAMFGRIHVWGWLAWVAWLTAHIYFLIGFRNRLVVLIDWAWAYWTFERSARVVDKGARPPG